jgi:hypothetical protein
MRGVILCILCVIAIFQSVSAQMYTPKGVGGGGALSGFSISPYSDHWFVGTDMGTLYRSANEGESWYPVSHFETRFSNDLPNACYIGFNPDTTVFFHA